MLDNHLYVAENTSVENKSLKTHFRMFCLPSPIHDPPHKRHPHKVQNLDPTSYFILRNSGVANQEILVPACGGVTILKYFITYHFWANRNWV